MKDTTSNQNPIRLRQKKSILEVVFGFPFKIIKFFLQKHIDVLIFILNILYRLYRLKSNKKKITNSEIKKGTLVEEDIQKQKPQKYQQLLNKKFQDKQQSQYSKSKQQEQQQTNESDQNQDHQNKNHIQENNDESKILQIDLKQQFIPQVNQVKEENYQAERQVETSQQNSINQQKQEIQEQQQEEIVKVNVEVQEQQQEEIVKVQEQQQEEIVKVNVEVQLEDSSSNKLDQQQQQEEPAQMEQQEIIGDQNVENVVNVPEFIERYQYLKEDDVDLLNQIANKSYKGRQVGNQFKYFIGEVENIQGTIKQYFGRNQNKFSKQIKQLKKEIIGHINIRGDGNCFYTSFLYQYLSILLRDEQRKNQFINEVEQLSAKIKYQNIEIKENKKIVQEFIWQFQQLKTKEELLKQMRDPDYLFYLLTILVFRRYFAHIFHNSQEFKELGDLNITKDLLTWEQECNNNETLIRTIVEHFKLHIILYYIDLQNSSYERKEYLPKNNEGVKVEKIFLLLCPGHYQIALPA
ncbi:unnamed protein product (macronuclear) [Paramecium tetraurelia]|uniref:ubiquitinyl hydrolase 1 n=1 Tax=Paramecium tetraurelia TaxID=5888 RepID=A0CXT1_PARTE|nr:uncharacterized protein GSPATT00011230001 [Paramecium tetraurelia]CAK75598.1 unnamed protein product [Paramecium tetraurelia]|eukprot:XP_001442995.1 hypothetical protein (macronuclear) [Paramecium tetraurelia strain d4-2]